jgi:hypothetical protein
MSESRQRNGRGAGARVAIALATALVAVIPPLAFAAAPLNGFALFGWVSPPAGFTTPDRLGEMAALGFDVVLPTQDDEGDPAGNHVRLDAAAAHGMRALVYDRRFFNAYLKGITTPAAGAVFDSIVAEYRGDPALLGYYLGDEPSGAWVDTIAMFHRELQKRDPGHVTWNNLLGASAFATDSLYRAYLNAYLDRVPASVLCADYYNFFVSGDRGRFFQNAAALRAVSDARGLPFWAVIQLTPHGPYRPLTTGELRWQVSQLLAYGARGIGYFTYWTPKPDSTLNWQPAVIQRDGTRTAWYDVLATFNARARSAGERLAGMHWISVQATQPYLAEVAPFAGNDWLQWVSGRATVGRFVDADGTPWLLFANRDSLNTQTLTLGLRGATGATRVDGGTPVWSISELSVTYSYVDLEPGDFALLRIDGTRGEALETLGPVVGAFANPVRGGLHVALDRVGGAARCDVIDALGRRLWTTPLAAGATEVVWDGSDARGSRAVPGVYVLRVHDNRGSTNRRLVWLGR